MHALAVAVCLVSLLCAAQSASAQAPALPLSIEEEPAEETTAETKKAETKKAETKKLEIGADFRYRVEQDWDSRRDDGSDRDDRFRMRYRLRAGFTYALDQYFKLGARARSGVPTNMQSPHLNVGYNGFSSGAFNLDKAYMAGTYRELWGWVGKNSFPLWKQNELFWDDDVTPAGIAGGAKITRGRITLAPTAAFFVANHDQVVAYDDGRIGMGQLAATIKANDKVTIDLASAYLRFVRIFDKPQHLGGMNRLNYKLIMSSARATIQLFEPLVIGIDHVINLEDYDDKSSVADHYKDQKTGFVAQAQLGSTKSQGDWLVAYYFAYKQKYSMVDYYVEDDWVRWGDINQNRNINYSGHEFRLAYAIRKKLNAVLRVYLVEALEPRLEKGPMAVTESGHRIRLDVNIGF